MINRLYFRTDITVTYEILVDKVDPRAVVQVEDLDKLRSSLRADLDRLVEEEMLPAPGEPEFENVNSIVTMYVDTEPYV
jgi:hypothetical protein